jgi:hypothetical protein
MCRTFNTPENSLQLGQDKDKHFEAQQIKVFESFKRQPSTMLMVSIETGILRANICRYVSEWQKSKSIVQIREGLCKISKHRAGYYTTDTILFSQPLKLS